MHALVAALLAAGALIEEEVPTQAALEASLREAVAASCPGHAFALDPDLTRAARAYVLAVREKRAQPGDAALSFFAGLEASDAATFSGPASVEPAARADRAVGDLFPHSCRFTHAGVAALALGGDRATVAVLTSKREVRLEHIPGQVAPGARVRVAGVLGPGLAQARLYVLHPGGKVDETPLPLAPDRSFTAEVPLRARGEHAVELLADGAGGPQVLALRRVFCGMAPPGSPPPPPHESGEGLAAVQAAIAVLRVAHGLPALSRDAALDDIAAGHSKAMAASRTFAHVLPSDGTLPDRLRAAGYAYRYAAENIGLAQDAPAAHRTVEGSPAHLAALLDARPRRVGLGLARGTSPDGGEAIYLTEVLAAPVVGVRDPAGEVARLLGEERRKRRLPALERDGRLDAIALSEVRILSLGAGEETLSAAARRAREENPELRSAAAELVVATAPEEAVPLQNLLKPEWTRVGVGAIYASSRQYGPGRLWVLIVYGR